MRSGADSEGFLADGVLLLLLLWLLLALEDFGVRSISRTEEWCFFTGVCWVEGVAAEEEGVAAEEDAERS